MPVITPTGYLATNANCPIRSDAKTKMTPTRPAGIMFENPTPTSLFAIGPERNATKAIGPVVAVANAIISTELIISISLVLLVSIPSEVAACSPSSNISNRFPSKIITGVKIRMIMRG